ncbi:hypothetical protein C8R44DRAFT_920908 [Mycena epipterygia]|nr:hypothetical protein C8R44DRAFT_920908 [Mycena epipterygia]
MGMLENADLPLGRSRSSDKSDQMIDQRLNRTISSTGQSSPDGGAVLVLALVAFAAPTRSASFSLQCVHSLRFQISNGVAGDVVLVSARRRCPLPGGHDHHPRDVPCQLRSTSLTPGLPLRPTLQPPLSKSARSSSSAPADQELDHPINRGRPKLPRPAPPPPPSNPTTLQQTKLTNIALDVKVGRCLKSPLPPPPPPRLVLWTPPPSGKGGQDPGRESLEEERQQLARSRPRRRRRRCLLTPARQT